MSSPVVPPQTPPGRPEQHSRTRALDVLARWRVQGFDRVTCYPSGYCCPTNSSAMRAAPPAAYRVLTLESDEACDAVERAIRLGATFGRA